MEREARNPGLLGNSPAFRQQARACFLHAGYGFVQPASPTRRAQKRADADARLGKAVGAELGLSGLEEELKAQAAVPPEVARFYAPMCPAGVYELGDGGAQHAAPLHKSSQSPSIRPHAFIALDGAGIERIVHRALGARRYRVTYLGPGGHSWAAFGVANPANAVGRAIERIASIPAHGAPRTAHSVVRLGGGTGLNSIPQNAWFDLDLRSEDPRALEKLDGAVQTILTQALEEENRHRVPGTAPLTIDVRRVGDRPSGLTPRTHPLVQTAVAATRAVGHEHQLACASTDANVPIALGVPAVALGAGGRAGDAHLPTEWYENDKGALGIVRALLVTAAMAEAQ